MKENKNVACERAKLTGAVEDWDFYNKLRNEYTKSLRIAESDFYNKSINDNRGDQKKMWKVLKEIIGKSNKSEIKSLIFDDEMIVNQQVYSRKIEQIFRE